MIEAVKNIGEIELESLKENGGTILDIFTQDPGDGGKYNIVFFINIGKQMDSFHYRGIEHRGYRSDAISRYLYRSGSGARGPDVTPTAKLTVAEKTVPNKIIRAVSDGILFAGEKFLEEREELQKIKQVLEKHQKQIVDDIQEKQKQLGKEGNKVIISLMVTSESEEKWVGDWEIFREKFKADCEKLFAEKYNKVSTAQNEICAVCLERKEVFGFASTFQFYTLDKPGYIAGGFKQQDAWKNYPVCFDCGAKLELGKKYIECHLTKSFYYRQMMIVPKTLWKEDLPLVLKRLRARLAPKQEKEEGKKKQSEVEKVRFGEESIIGSLGSMGQQVTYNLVFFEQKQSGAVFNILLNIEDVLPSRLSYIYDQLHKVNSMAQFKHFPVGKGEYPFNLSIGIFNELFPYKTHNRYFLEMIHSLITGSPIEAGFLLRRLMEKISEQFNQPDGKNEKFYDNYTAWRYYQLVIYLGRLGLLPTLFKTSGGETEVVERARYNLKDFSSVEEMFETFFSKQNGLYEHSAAKACFLVGYLSQHLMNFQRQELGRTPFKVQLKGLSLKEKDVRDLVRKLQAKFMDYSEAYKGFYPCPREFELMSSYVQSAGKNWPLSMQEIGFFIAVGMNGKNLFSFAKEEKGNE